MTLTETAKFTKRGFILFVLLIFLSIAGWFGYQYYYQNYIYLPSLANLAPKPDVNFGILPLPNLKYSSDSASLQYNIDTATGSLPDNLPNILKVYFIPKGSITLLAPDRAKEIAKSFNFNEEPEIRSATEYSFSDNSGGRLLIDLETLNFKFRKNAATSSAQLTTTPLPNEEKLISDFKGMLANKGLLLDQISNASAKVRYNGSPNTSTSATISLWQNDVDEFKTITTNFKDGLIKTTVASSQDPSEGYLEMDFIYWPIDTEQFATYPLKTPTQALEDLKSGNNVAIVERPSGSEISLTNLSIVYILDELYTPFLQPVYLFSGVGFNAIVPAITSDYLR